MKLKKAKNPKRQVQPWCPFCKKNDQTHHDEYTTWHCVRCKKDFTARYFMDGDRYL